jgi:hypothetical protein
VEGDPFHDAGQFAVRGGEGSRHGFKYKDLLLSLVLTCHLDR